MTGDEVEYARIVLTVGVIGAAWVLVGASVACLADPVHLAWADRGFATCDGGKMSSARHRIFLLLVDM